MRESLLFAAFLIPVLLLGFVSLVAVGERRLAQSILARDTDETPGRSKLVAYFSVVLLFALVGLLLTGRTSLRLYEVLELLPL